MAQVTEVRLVDDLDGGEAHETVQFSVDGVEYAIDLSKDHAEALRQSFEEYVEKARKTSAAPARARRQSPRRTSRSDGAVIREWARANGHTVSDRGRVSQAVMEAYANRESA